MARPDWQQRVIDEQRELQGRLDRLHAFVLGGQFEELPEVERLDLARQVRAMIHYNEILVRRIARFGVPT